MLIGDWWKQAFEIRPVQNADLNFVTVFLRNCGFGSASVFFKPYRGSARLVGFVVNTTLKFACGFLQYKKWHQISMIWFEQIKSYRLRFSPLPESSC